MKSSMGSTALHLACIVLLSYLFLFHALGAYSLKEPDEGRYAEIPREMVESGDYVVPYLNYCRYFEKPPLLYWTSALSYKVFGVSEWSFRLPNALFAFLTVLALYLFGRRWFGARPAFLSSAILVSSLGFFSMGRIVTTDMLLTLLASLALLSFYGFYREKRKTFLALFYLSLSLATLTKGPVAVLLVVLTLVLFLAAERRLSFLREMRPARGVALFLLLTAPWFILISFREKGFFYFFFVDQHILRFLTSKHRRTGPLYYFLPVLFGGLFPWSVLLPRALLAVWRRREFRLFLLWSAVVFVFFSLSRSKLPPYILPVFPFVSLALGCLVHEAWRGKAAPRKEKGIFICIFSLCFCVGTLYVLGPFAGYPALLFPEAALSPSGLKVFALLVAGAGLLLVLFLLLRRGTFSSLFLALLFFEAVLMVGLLCSMGVIDDLNTTKRLALLIDHDAAKGDLVADYGSFEETLPFYTLRRVYLASYRGELEMGSEYGDARPFFPDDAAFIRLFRSEKRLFCVVKTGKLGHLRGLGIGGQELARQAGRSLISNHP
jgi:4-amino-4-deoxy-L-arabinose transferase-like glycosyltransferase